MENKNSIVNAETLRTWLEEDKPVFILDVRPREQREEWQIPGSHYLDAYERLNQGDNSVLDEIEIPRNSKVITVCAAGRTSQIASEVLRNKGVDAYSLEGGMKAWSLAWNKADIFFDSYKIIQLRRTGKGCLSYIIVSGNEAIIIDASLPIEIYKNILRQNKWNLTAVMETHIHADHLSRSKQLADNQNVELYLPTPNKVLFEHISIQKNQTILAKLPPTPPNFLSIVEKNLKGDFSDINPVDLEAGANRCAIS